MRAKKLKNFADQLNGNELERHLRDKTPRQQAQVLAYASCWAGSWIEPIDYWLNQNLWKSPDVQCFIFTKNLHTKIFCSATAKNEEILKCKFSKIW